MPSVYVCAMLLGLVIFLANRQKNEVEGSSVENRSLLQILFSDFVNSTTIVVAYGKGNYTGECADFWDEGPKQHPDFLLLLQLFTAL